MAQTCKTWVPCLPSPTYPMLGVSSETPDAEDFIANEFAPNQPPPLGWAFGLTTGFAIATSQLSRAAAVAQGKAQALLNAQATWESPSELPPVPQTMPVNAIDLEPFDVPFITEPAIV